MSKKILSLIVRSCLKHNRVQNGLNYYDLVGETRTGSSEVDGLDKININCIKIYKYVYERRK